MQNSFTAKPHVPTRQDQLNAWLAYNRLTKNEIGKRMGITGAMAGMLLNGSKNPTPKRIKQMLALGIPMYLLPINDHNQAEELRGITGD